MQILPMCDLVFKLLEYSSRPECRILCRGNDTGLLDEFVPKRCIKMILLNLAAFCRASLVRSPLLVFNGRMVSMLGFPWCLSPGFCSLGLYLVLVFLG